MFSQCYLTHICFVALHCTGGDCDGTLDIDCVADYCQPWRCTVTGQCVHRQVCSHDTHYSRCVCTLQIKLTK